MEKSGRLLIVGGTGFIGRGVAREAINRRFQVSIISKNNCPKLKQIKGVEYIVVDITKKNELLLKLKGKLFDYVLNLGGYVDHTNYSSGGSGVYDAHFNGVRNLIDCLNKVGLKGFLQIGSSDEYGGNPAPQYENQRESPISPYSCAKVASTYFLQTLYKTERFPAIIFRPFLVYGPGQSDDRFIPQIIKGCLSGKSFPVSRGEQLRDFCFIDDFIEAVFLALDNKAAHGEVINIASGKPVSIKNMIEKIVSIVGFGRPKYGGIKYREGENMTLYGDISKSKYILDWEATTSLDQGLKKTFLFVNNNE
jgi:nucleoside-diphosphate-sugar epimerase|tara:strand:- start:456 stop:1379 length:924 start_codon:yes stop_codon:yes gene_type:complete